MNPKFDYTPDPSHTLLQRLPELAGVFADVCPVLLSGLREKAQAVSSARLLATSTRLARQATVLTLLSHMLDAGEQRLEAATHVAQSKLVVAINLEELGRRYAANELEPEMHVGDDASSEWIAQQLEREDAVNAAIDEIAELPRVNATSDGIA